MPAAAQAAAIVHGFTEYCRQQGTFPPAGLDRMLQRVTGEIPRMETLVERLRMRSAGESTGPDRGPGPIATDPAAHARLPAPANRRPVATTQRDRPSSRPIPDPPCRIFASSICTGRPIERVQIDPFGVPYFGQYGSSSRCRGCSHSASKNSDVRILDRVPDVRLMKFPYGWLRRRSRRRAWSR